MIGSERGNEKVRKKYSKDQKHRGKVSRLTDNVSCLVLLCLFRGKNNKSLILIHLNIKAGG